MSRFTEVMDGFVKDENGKFHIRPMKLPDHITANLSEQKSEQKRAYSRRKYIPIEPLGLEELFKDTAQAVQSPQIQAKRRKIEEKQIRKELFKQPEKKPVRRFMSFGSRTSSVSKKFTVNMKPQLRSTTKKTKTQVSFDGSPLLDVDEAEKLLSQNKLITKPVKTVLFPINEAKGVKANNPKSKMPMTSPLGKTETTPSSRDSMKSELEFLQLEQALASCKKSNKSGVSPLSSICTLLENTTIKTSQSDGLEKNKIIEDVLLLVKEDQEQWNTLKQQFSTYQEQHDRNLNKVAELLEQLAENKENVNRKSLRIASQSIKTKFVVSPAIAHKVDLRKSTLNKNLSKNLEIDSPRTRSAVNMYNNLRNECTVLCTPKIDRTNIDKAQASVTRSLSRRIQKQCLLLQDTPRPHS